MGLREAGGVEGHRTVFAINDHNIHLALKCECGHYTIHERAPGENLGLAIHDAQTMHLAHQREALTAREMNDARTDR